MNGGNLLFGSVVYEPPASRFAFRVPLLLRKRGGSGSPFDFMDSEGMTWCMNPLRLAALDASPFC